MKKVNLGKVSKYLTVIAALVSLFSCTVSPAQKVYIQTAKERGVSLNEPFTIISQVTERDGVEISRSEGANLGYQLVQEGHQINVSSPNGTRHFHLINLQQWANQTLNSDFIKKLDNPSHVLGQFLSDVEAIYVGGQGRVYMQSIALGGNQKILEVRPENKFIWLKQKARTVSIKFKNNISKTFSLDESVFNSIPRDSQWTIAFSDAVSGAILLSNDTRTMFTLIENQAGGGTLFSNFAIEDGLFELKNGKYKYVVLREDYTVETAFLMPTRNFACAELTQAYYDKQLEAGIQIASSVILGIIQSYTNYSSTTMSGHAYSYNTGDTYVGSGHATTYDYRYIGDRAGEVLNAAAIAGKSSHEIKRVMAQYSCVIP